MTRVNALALLLALALAIAVTNSLAYEHAWYWRYWWLDLIMHFSAGVFVAGAVRLSGVLKQPLEVAAVALAVGATWEVFEYITKISYSRSYVLDTGLDLLMDIVGALVLSAMMRWWSRNSALRSPAEPGASPGQIS